MKATNSNERFALVQNLTVVLCPAIALFDLSAHAVTNELVGSAESHSIERFDNNGNWIKTFASAGPYYTVGFAASPVNGGVFVSTFTATVLRYTNRGASFGPNGSYWSTFNMSSLVGANPSQALLLDSSGDLILATNYGESGSGYTVESFDYSYKELKKEAPVPIGPPIKTTIEEGGQSAWDVLGNLCIASWYSPQGAQCYNPITRALAYDYSSEFLNQGIEPVGLAFGPSNILTVSSLFSGQVFAETTPRIEPLNLIVTGTVQPAEVGFLAVDRTGNLYLPEWHNVAARYRGQPPDFCTYYSCQDADTRSDIVYKIDPASGAVTNFISNHLWGPYQMIFVPS
jgi:hypothetical protein